MVVWSEYKWCFEGIVEEAKQVAVDEQLAAQQGNEAAGVPLEPGTQFEEADQQQRDQCCPKLDLRCIGRRAHERLDPQVLLDALEEELSGKELARC